MLACAETQEVLCMLECCQGSNTQLLCSQRVVLLSARGHHRHLELLSNVICGLGRLVITDEVLRHLVASKFALETVLAPLTWHVAIIRYL